MSTEQKETLFRFLHVRPVQRADESNNVTIRPPLTPLYTDLKTSRAKPEEYKKVLSDFSKSSRINDKRTQWVDLADELIDFGDSTAIRNEWERLTGQPLLEFIKTERFRTDTENLWDTYFYSVLERSKSDVDSELISFGIRRWAFLSDVSDRQGQPMSRQDVEQLKVMLPADILPSRVDAEDTGQEQEVRKNAESHLNELLLLAARKWKTSKEISAKASIGASLQSGDYAYTSKTEGDITKADASSKNTPWPYTDNGKGILSADARDLLDGISGRYTNSSAYDLERGLELEALADLKTAFTGLPPYLLSLVAPKVSLAAVEAIPFPTATIKAGSVDQPGASFGKGKSMLRPLGIGDLLVVRQTLVGYKLGEIAHVENVLASERRARKHTRGSKLEQTIETETENSQESEKDLQTTERFELQSEASKIIASQASTDAGAAMSASYGAVTFSAHADTHSSQSIQSAAKTTSNYSKQITESSVERVATKTRKLQSQKLQEYFEENNEHSFDNSGGKKNITGIYRWLNKRYRARLVNYGRRLMFEFVVPEPAAFYRFQKTNFKTAGASHLPQEPMIWGKRLQPVDLNAGNVGDFVSQYAVRDVQPYPGNLTAGLSISSPEDGATGNKSHSKTGDISLPEGYIAEDWRGIWTGIGWPGNIMHVSIGGADFANRPSVWGLSGKIPLSILGWSGTINANVEIYARPSPEKISSWQLDTYAKIIASYQMLLDEATRVEEDVTKQSFGENPENSTAIERDELKRAAIRMLADDFKRIKIDGQWRNNEIFDAMKPAVSGSFPDFDIAEATVEGKIIQFFEQAFEWQNISYIFYPYFWGSSPTWSNRFSIEKGDSKFKEFLSAGAARVVIPTSPEYNDAVLYYIKTGEIWGGADAPTIDDPLYQSIAAELKARDEINFPDQLPTYSPGIDPPFVVDEWDVNVPTDLVYLQEDATLPWDKDVPSGFDLEEFLDDKSAELGGSLDWRVSVVDLLLVLRMDSSWKARKTLAISFGYEESHIKPGSSAQLNTWLHSRIVDKLLKSAGKWPHDA